MLLSDLVATSKRVAATRARGEKVGLLAELLRRLAPEEIEPAVAFLSGTVRQGRIGLGWASVDAASRDREPSSTDAPGSLSLFDAIPAAASTLSASGAAAGSSSGATAGSSSGATAGALAISDVDEAFERIAVRVGAGSSAERTRLLAALLRRASGEERDFLSRLILGELRQGALGGIMEEAIARASEIPLAEIRRAIMLAGDLLAVARAALVEGRPGLACFALVLFRPIHPMLAQPAQDLVDAFERLGEPAFEYKLDGARVQVHRSGDDIRVYSRTLNDVTVAVPELVEAVRRLPARELILDGEAVALRPDGTPHPFQITMRRFGRKLDVERMRGELPVTPYFFDVLHLDGRDWIDAPAADRFQALIESAPELVVPRLVTADPSAAEAFFDQALARGHEGLMAKSLAAPYEAGGRGYSWLKVKPAHTLDLVVLAAEWGHGRRSGWLSNIHLGARDPVTGGYAMIGKTFKGMTDEILAWQTRRFQELAVTSEGPVVYLRPELVVEVAFNDVQESPRYESGMALRLARIKRYREDKPPEEADTVETVRAILEGQVKKVR